MACMIICLATQCSISFGHFLSTVSPTVAVASALAAPILGPLMIFSGHFLNNSYVFFYNFAIDDFISQFDNIYLFKGQYRGIFSG